MTETPGIDPSVEGFICHISNRQRASNQEAKEINEHLAMSSDDSAQAYIEKQTTHPRNLWRSTGAGFLGFVAVVVLSLGTDEVFHLLKVYPPWDQPMNDTSDNLLALANRCVYAAFGSYLAARFAPRNPMRHALALGVIGLVLSAAGAIATIPMHLGPNWYPISIVLTALPCAWLGGVIHRNTHPHPTGHFPYR